MTMAAWKIAFLLAGLLTVHELQAGLEKKDPSTRVRKLTQRDQPGNEGESRFGRVFEVVRVGVPGAEFFIEGDAPAQDAKSADGELGAINLINFLTNLIFVLLQCFVAAFTYASFKNMRVTSWPASSTGDFPDGIFDCTKDMQICLWSLCCPIVQTSRTAHVSGLRNFWPSLILCAVLLAWPTWLGLAFFALFRLTLRAELRKAAGLKENPGMDCCVVCCCICCSVSQEARYVNFVHADQCVQADEGSLAVGKAARPEASLPSEFRMADMCNYGGSNSQVQKCIVSTAIAFAILLGLFAILEIMVNESVAEILVEVENVIACFAVLLFCSVVGLRCCAPCCFGDEMPDVPHPWPLGECSMANAKLLDYPSLLVCFCFPVWRCLDTWLLTPTLCTDPTVLCSASVADWAAKLVWCVGFGVSAYMGCSKLQILRDNEAAVSQAPVGQTVGAPVEVTAAGALS